jgi:DNA-binding transcriptional ArsR family regulator
MVVDELSQDEADRVFHALADATRRDIVVRVLSVEHSVSNLADRYPMSFLFCRSTWPLGAIW